MKTAVLALLLGLCAYASADSICSSACRQVKNYCGKGYKVGVYPRSTGKVTYGSPDELLKKYCSAFPDGCGAAVKDTNNDAPKAGEQMCTHACSQLKGYCGSKYEKYTFNARIQKTGKKVSGSIDTLLKNYCAAYPGGCGSSDGGSTGDDTKTDDNNGGSDSGGDNDNTGDSDNTGDDKEDDKDDTDSGDSSDTGSSAQKGTNSAACAMKQSSGASQKCLNLNKMRKEAVDKTNEYRAKHGASALVEDECLNGMAQTYAEKLIADDKFAHSKQRGGCGENLYSSWGGANTISQSTNGGSGITSWYNEIKDYNFSKGAGNKESDVVGHFTQLVWKGSKRVGHGIASNKDCSKIMLVANYDPPGNYGGQYVANVSQ